MDVNKYFTVENLLKLILAVAIGFMLYKIFFAKESFYTCKNDQSGHAYPMTYEHDTKGYEVENFDDFENSDNEIQGVDKEGNLYENAKNGTAVYNDKMDHEMIDDEDDDEDEDDDDEDDDE